MTTLVAERKYTADELLALPDADRYELLHGRLVERDMGTKSSWLATQVTIAIGPFLQDHPLGYLLDAQTSYACFPDDPGHAPRPDVSFIRFGRLPNEEVPEGNCRIPPDLMVEVVSPNDNAEELSDKIVEFQAVGGSVDLGDLSLDSSCPDPPPPRVAAGPDLGVGRSGHDQRRRRPAGIQVRRVRFIPPPTAAGVWARRELKSRSRTAPEFSSFLIRPTRQTAPPDSA